MSKGQKRSNRELKKPKQAKTKIATNPISSVIQLKPGAFGGRKKKQ